jgi:hypothetical protein
MIETVMSRCLRLNFGPGRARRTDAAAEPWLGEFSTLAAAGRQGLLARYRLLDALLSRLTDVRADVAATLSEQSPLEQFDQDDLEEELRKRWEDELAAAVEAEYRRRRAEVLETLQWWSRDVWLHTLEVDPGLLGFPELADQTTAVARRVGQHEAGKNLRKLEQTQRLLTSNVQEALALEVGLLRLRL